MATAMVQQQQQTQHALPPRQGPLLSGNAGAVRLEGGHYLVGEDDDILDKPEVYYHPQRPDLKFRLVPGQYPLPHFDQGRFVVKTKRQREMVRAILGGNADRWMGDTPGQDEDLVARNGSTVIVTRNIKAYHDFLRYHGIAGA
jgi:hypothetical protein